MVRALLLALCASTALGRDVYDLDVGWKFTLAESDSFNCSETTFPLDMSDQQCFGLSAQLYVTDAAACRAVCCGDDSCGVWQWCPAGEACAASGQADACWTGALGNCVTGKGWVSEGRGELPPPPAPADNCSVPECAADFDDASWRDVRVPHGKITC